LQYSQQRDEHPEIRAMRSPSIANRCIVPARRNGSLMSPVNAVRQPSVMAQSRRSGSSSAGKPSESVRCDQFKKRSVNGGLVNGVAPGCQSFVEPVFNS